MRGLGTRTAPYRAPELCLGDSANFPVDLLGVRLGPRGTRASANQLPWQDGLQRDKQYLEEGWHAHATTRVDNTLASPY